MIIGFRRYCFNIILFLITTFSSCSQPHSNFNWEDPIILPELILTSKKNQKCLKSRYFNLRGETQNVKLQDYPKMLR